METAQDNTWPWWSSSSGQIEIQLMPQTVEDIAQSGDNLPAIEAHMEFYTATLEQWPNSLKAEVLSDYGAWDEAELTDEHENNLRLLWIAAHDIKEETI